jgi:hypothetical protein
LYGNPENEALPLSPARIFLLWENSVCVGQKGWDIRYGVQVGKKLHPSGLTRSLQVLELFPRAVQLTDPDGEFVVDHGDFTYGEQFFTDENIDRFACHPGQLDNASFFKVEKLPHGHAGLAELHLDRSVDIKEHVDGICHRVYRWSPKRGCFRIPFYYIVDGAAAQGKAAGGG